jgi:hypothetical protein
MDQVPLNLYMRSDTELTLHVQCSFPVMLCSNHIVSDDNINEFERTLKRDGRKLNPGIRRVSANPSTITLSSFKVKLTFFKFCHSA